MAAKTLTISMPDEQMAFLEDHKEISPSEIFQFALTNIIKQHQVSEKDIQAIRNKADRLQENLLQATEFIQEQNLWEKFLETKDLRIK